MLQRWADDLQELLLLLLFELGTLSRDQVVSDIFLRILWKSHILHRCVSHIDLLLKAAILLADLTNEHGHLTENDSVVKDKAHKNDKGVADFKLCTRAHFVTTQGKHSHVKHDHVLVEFSNGLLIIEPVVTNTLDVDIIKRGRPFLFDSNDEEHDATDDMKSQEHNEDEFDDLHDGLLVLLQLQFLDDLREARDTSNLEDLEKFENGLVKERPWDCGNQVENKHALHVTDSNLFPIAHLFALHTEVRSTELDADVDQEKHVTHVGEHLVAVVSR